MGRIGRGWELTKTSWAVVKADRSLLGFAVLAVVAAIVVAVVFFGAGAGLIFLTNADWAALPLALAGIYLLTVISIFFSVALAACAARALDGHDTSIGEGIAAARSRLGPILGWAGVQLVVGVIISALQSLLRQGAGAIISAILGGLANFAWAVATFFVIPTIALEGLGPIDALKRSTQVIKARWGEGLVGSAAIGIISFLLGFLPGILLIALGAALTQTALIPIAIALITLGIIVIAVAAVLQTTVVAVFRTALFRFATENRVLGPFSPDQLQGAFAHR